MTTYLRTHHFLDIILKKGWHVKSILLWLTGELARYSEILWIKLYHLLLAWVQTKKPAKIFAGFIFCSP
ncbi:MULTISPECIES: hypothetical protein [Sphingobacterium]|jgi:hypothetical protein|uniref:hypothetical protein n=1 Tax=Sphingobacterium TaxID=28453 RepID=UPI0008A1072C|nr:MULTISPECIES: hypothetical protein [Sphingobacterium]OFV18958.1 hypothetical protein HMPREF3127_05945 [Sphingobacterium sp. HMSC13C05]